MSDQERQRNEKQHNRQQPQHDVRVPGLHRSAEEFRDDDDQDLGKYEIDDAKFAAKFCAVRSNVSLGGCEGRVSCGGQGLEVARSEVHIKNLHFSQQGRKVGLPLYFFSAATAGFNNKS